MLMLGRPCTCFAKTGEGIAPLAVAANCAPRRAIAEPVTGLLTCLAMALHKFATRCALAALSSTVAQHSARRLVRSPVTHLMQYYHEFTTSQLAAAHSLGGHFGV